MLRPESLRRYDGRLRVESALLGDFDAGVPAVPALDRPVDVLWVTTKATQLEEALELVPSELLDEAVVVPLLNGVEHVPLLRERLGAERILPGTIYVESERVDVGVVRQKTAFVQLALAPHVHAAAVCEEVEAAGLGCSVGASESAVLWQKLATLAPIALTTTPTADRSRRSSPTRPGTAASRRACGKSRRSPKPKASTSTRTSCSSATG